MRLKRALEEFVVEGMKTTLPLAPAHRPRRGIPRRRLHHQVAGDVAGSRPAREVIQRAHCRPLQPKGYAASNFGGHMRCLQWEAMVRVIAAVADRTGPRRSPPSRWSTSGLARRCSPGSTSTSCAGGRAADRRSTSPFPIRRRRHRRRLRTKPHRGDASRAGESAADAAPAPVVAPQPPSCRSNRRCAHRTSPEAAPPPRPARAVAAIGSGGQRQRRRIGSGARLHPGAADQPDSRQRISPLRRLSGMRSGARRHHGQGRIPTATLRIAGSCAPAAVRSSNSLMCQLTRPLCPLSPGARPARPAGGAGHQLVSRLVAAALNRG